MDGSPAVPTEAGPKLRPVDEAAKDPTFVAFRDRLRAAVQRRDTRYLLSILHPNIRVSFGEGGGVESFKKDWKPEDPNSKVWITLEEILRLGGAYRDISADQKYFCAPYVFSSYPEDGPDAYQAPVVIEPNTLLLDQPNGRPIARLDYDIVTSAAGDPEYRKPDSEWRKVVTASGKTGFVPARSVRMHLDYRACFEKTGGEWKMALLVAGD